MTPTPKTTTTAARKSDVVEANHLVCQRLLFVILAIFGLNRTPNYLSRISLDKSFGPKCTVASICFALLALVSFCFFGFVPLVIVSVLAGRVFSLLYFMSLSCIFGIFLDDLHVVQIAIVSLSCSQFFSDQKTNLPAHSWRSRTVPDHLCLDATELIRALLPNQYDKSCRSFLDGVGPCNQRFGNRNGCHGLSIDLSFVLSSTCHSRDLMLEIHP